MNSPTSVQLARPVHSYAEFCSIDKTNMLGSIDESVQTSVLCTQCQQIRTWLESNLHRLTRDRFIRTKHKFDHYVSGRELEKSYQQGCHLCTLLWTVFLNYETPQKSIMTLHLREAKNLTVVLKSVEKSQSSSSFYMYLTATMISPYYCVAHLYLSLHSSMEGPMRSKISESTPKIPVNGVGGEIRSNDSGGNAIRDWLRRKAYGDTASKAHTVAALVIPIPILTSSLPLRTLSDKVLQKTMNWIDVCSASHVKCKTLSDGGLPSRLIDLKDVQRLQFVCIVRVPVPSPPDLKYAALSYCWGGKSTLQLKMSTASTLEVGISVCTLPKTIQDAIQFAAALGLKWLWIDSLCIIQDSKEDFDRELRSMWGIYQNCFISIAALDAKDSDEGLYACRDPLMYADCELARTSQEQAIVINSGYPRGTSNKVPQLYRRGWVVQERILPPRTIILGRIVAWECRETRKIEFNGAGPAILSSTIKLDFFHAVTRSGGKLAATDDELVRIRAFWTIILNTYLKTNLTKESDKLKAISGIVSAIQARTNWQNIGGLWVPFLFTELLWQRNTITSAYLTGISPSWSWASVQCEIFLFSGSILQRFVEVNVEDGEVDCLKDKKVLSGETQIILQISGTLMKLNPVEFDYEYEYRKVHEKRCTFQVLPDIELGYGDSWIPDIDTGDDYPGYFLHSHNLRETISLGWAYLE